VRVRDCVVDEFIERALIAVEVEQHTLEDVRTIHCGGTPAILQPSDISVLILEVIGWDQIQR
jgi:hypothetical protein